MKALEWTTQKRTVAHLYSIGWEKNPRNLSDEKKAKLEHSLQKFNLVEIPAINLPTDWSDEKELIIAGHQRIYLLYQAGRGEEEIDCRVPNRPLTESEFKEYNITSNVNFGEWDLDLLEEEFADLNLFDLGVDLPGLKGPEDTLGADEDEKEQKPSSNPAIISVGDVFQIGNHILICGDSTNSETIKTLLQGKTPQLMATDPPYGVEYDAQWRERAGVYSRGTARSDKVQNDDQADWREAYKLSKAPIAFVWHASSYSDIVKAGLQEAGYIIRQQIIWVKPTAALSRSHYHWQHEPCWYAVQKGENANWKSDRRQTTVWEFPSPIQVFGKKNHSDGEKTKHPTQKPVGVFRRPIINHTSPGDLVHDPFIGSGSSLIACEQTNRACRGSDLEPSWIELVIARWYRYVSKLGREPRFSHLNGELTLNAILTNQADE